MNRTVRFLPEALDDLLETQGWYASREPALAQAFAEAIALAVERIAQDPKAFPCVHGGVLRLVVRRFPYAVYFREAGDELLVLAIHGRQDPRRWQQRT
jgi:plasmid stabilization system protein ParE